MRKIFKNEIGISLIALVVTIVVLIILAAISIGVLTGENGIINNSKQAKEDTEIAEEKETVELSAVQAAGKDVYGNVERENLKNALDNNIGEGKYTLIEENNNFKVTYTDSNRSYYVDKDGKVERVEIDEAETIYNEPGAEDNIAPEDIFLYEIIDDESIGSINSNNLPTKKARIIGMNPKYCNKTHKGYTTETGETYADTNYEIILDDGSKISDTLVIPYQKEINGEMFLITEVSIAVKSSFTGLENTSDDNVRLPNVQTIIYPNTVKKVYNEYGDIYASEYNTTLKKVILPDNLEEIGKYTFNVCEELISIDIPETVKIIGEGAFARCTGLIEIEIPENVTIIKEYAFWDCRGLTSIILPNSVTSIEYRAFSNCRNLTTVNYKGTNADWNILLSSIQTGNDYLTNAKIICTDE